VIVDIAINPISYSELLKLQKGCNVPQASCSYFKKNVWIGIVIMMWCSLGYWVVVAMVAQLGSALPRLANSHPECQATHDKCMRDGAWKLSIRLHCDWDKNNCNQRKFNPKPDAINTCTFYLTNFISPRG
jgi:hypothetical protein